MRIPSFPSWPGFDTAERENLLAVLESGAWYEHHLMGGNYRLTEFQAAVLCAQVDRYPDQIVRRDTNGGTWMPAWRRSTA